MSILQLNPPIPMSTNRGKGLAYLVIDYGLEHDLLWTISLNDSGEIWTFKNKDVRAPINITAGRCNISEVESKGFLYDLVTGKLDTEK